MNEYFSCPHLTPASYDSSYGINNARIAIVMAVAKASDYEEFVYAINATKCYAAHFGYQMHIIELYENHELEKNCNHTHLFFKRHCALAWLMESNRLTIDYALYLDADMGVINPCHTIQEYVVKDVRVHLTFYERYFNVQFAAGSYIAK
uniref:Hexosyltransferase n=1 Tax=Panagrolaimus sp. ES5 TaxID=591445 RepID=A0AC34FZC2_9BILA